jgi:hypothetical protein
MNNWYQGSKTTSEIVYDFYGNYYSDASHGVSILSGRTNFANIWFRNAATSIIGGFIDANYSKTPTLVSTHNFIVGGKLGIGTTTPGSNIQVSGNAAIGYSSGTAAPSNGLCVSGNVGIGTTNPDATLAVNGTIHSRNEITVDNNGTWNDWVFENNYKPMPVFELEKYISQNKHLPGIPSAEEVNKNGIKLAEMNKQLLKQVEELTLYMIEQSKQIQILQKEVEGLKNK